MLFMRRPIVFIAPGLTLLLAGFVMLLLLSAFRSAEPEPASAPQLPQPPLMVVDQAPELIGALTPEVRKMPGVTAAVEVRTGTRWLAAWLAEGGEPVTPPANYFVPVDVAAVDPAQYRELLPPDLQDRAAGLSTGAILSETSAHLRGIPEQGSVAFDTQQTVAVTAVLPDGLTNHHEIVVSMETGSRLGLEKRRYLLVALSAEADAAAIETQIGALVPPGQTVRVRSSDGTGIRPLSGLLSMAELKTQLGEFAARPAAGRAIEIHQDWIDANTVLTTVPGLGGEFRCHRIVIPQIAAAMAEIERQGLQHLIDAGDFGGCFSARYISHSPESNLSRHSWGAAFDINVQSNLYGHAPTMDPRIVEIIESFGFSWGGRWDLPDGMHFEFVRIHP